MHITREMEFDQREAIIGYMASETFARMGRDLDYAYEKVSTAAANLYSYKAKWFTNKAKLKFLGKEIIKCHYSK